MAETSLKVKDPETFLNLVTLMEQHYQLEGGLLTEEAAVEEYSLPVGLVQKALKQPDFVAALEERGINVTKYLKPDDWTARSLTAEQLMAANSYLDLIDTRTLKRKLQDLNVSTSKWAAWLKDPIFQSYLRSRAENLLGDSQHEAATALLDKVRIGDIKAIEFYYEVTGKYTRQRAPVASVANQQIDVNALIVQIIEIIDMRVADTDTKMQIGADLKRLIQVRQMANQLTNTEPLPVGSLLDTVPESAPLERPEVVKVNKANDFELEYQPTPEDLKRDGLGL